MTTLFGNAFWRRWLRGRARRREAYFERVLGTSLEIQAVVDRSGAMAEIERVVLLEIRRLEQVFSIYHPESELLRWCETHGSHVPVSDDLARALDAAERWRQTTRGAFDPRTETDTRYWQAVENGTHIPGRGRRSSDATDPSAPLWIVNTASGGATARKLAPGPISLNALAKGIIIDQACMAAAAVPGTLSVMVNVGGDLRHIGEHPVRVGVADPFVDAENAPPIATLEICDQGLATSGGYRRGFHVDGAHRSHIIDPATGEPASEIVSATVLADSTADADALATAFSVLPPQKSLELAEGVAGIQCMIVSADRQIWSSSGWPADLNPPSEQ